jgi:hypothetical protein
MDKSKPPVLPNVFRLRSASERTRAGIDDAPPRLTDSGDRAVAPQSRSGQVEPRASEPPDKPSIAVYYRNEGEVSEGFFMALRAMGVAVDPLTEPLKHPVRASKAVKTPSSQDR